MMALVLVMMLGQAEAGAPSPENREPKTENREPSPEDRAPLSAELEAQAHAIGMVLRCPVCQGMPIAESPSDMAQAMMGRTRELLAEGKTREQVLDYFTARYGDWVLLEPRTSGINVVLWTLPAVALLAGLVVLRGYAKRSAPARRVVARADGADAYVDAVRREVDE